MFSTLLIAFRCHANDAGDGYGCGNRQQQVQMVYGPLVIKAACIPEQCRPCTGKSAGLARPYRAARATVWMVISTLSLTRRNKVLGFFMPHCT